MKTDVNQTDSRPPHGSIDVDRSPSDPGEGRRDMIGLIQSHLPPCSYWWKSAVDLREVQLFGPATSVESLTVDEVLADKMQPFLREPHSVTFTASDVH